MFNQVLRYYHTLKYLQWIQVKYRLFYQFSHLIQKPGIKSKPHFPIPPAQKLSLLPSISGEKSWLGKDRFCFLNLQHEFENGINWNFSGHGKLWTYNLNYFEFLLQPDLSKYEGLGLIHDYIAKTEMLQDGVEPFPTSLRLVNWVKFISQHDIADPQIDHSLYLQLQHLSKNIEYHLLGNHLLENGFSLLFGAIYFNDHRLLNLSKEILLSQLEEQILPDGGHFELSPMYHQLLLLRLLDSLNLLQSQRKNDQKELTALLKNKAAAMLSWLRQMTFANGEMPRVNDSVEGIAPAAEQLLDYAAQLEVYPVELPLRESGYRKFISPVYEILVDVGQIGPDYIPGHAHSDTFNFILHHQKKAVIVDPGISTYEKNERRNLERSTASHNTVMVAGAEQSEVWGGFRVARRAQVTELVESADKITACHNGYQRFQTIHQRSFAFDENNIVITDQLSTDQPAKAFFHFHPEVSPVLDNDAIVAEFGEIKFRGAQNISLVPYFYAEGFNQIKPSLKAVVTFRENLQTKITLK